MLKKATLTAGYLSTLCAVCICTLILIQNILRLPLHHPAISLGAAAAGGLVLWLVMRYMPALRSFPVLLFGLRFLLALSFILWADSQPVQDFNTMYTAAAQLAEGSFAYLNDTYFFNWAYQSAFVAYEALVIVLFGAGRALIALQVLNALWLSCTAVLVFRIAALLTGERAARAVGVLYALYPAPLFLAGVLTNQHLSVFLFYLGIYTLLRAPSPSLWRGLGAGALIALGNAIRPIGIIPLLACVIWLVFKAIGHADRKAALTALTTAVAYFLAGALLSGLIVLSGINPNGLSNNQPAWKFVAGLNQDSNGCWNRADYEEFIVPSGQDPDEADIRMREEIAQRLAVGPGKLAGLALRKSAVMWAGNEDLFWGFGHLDPQSTALPGMSWNNVQLLLASADKGIYLLAFALALWALLSRLRRREDFGPALPLVLLLCGYYAVHLAVEVQVRYRYFLMPCVFILAALALDKKHVKQ